MMLTAGAAASGTASGPPAGPTSAPFFQCPAIGLDATCQFLVDVTSSNPAVAPTVLQDPSQGYYDGSDDVTVAIQNDSSAPLSSVHLGVAHSGDGAFSFDGDGLCEPGSGPSPDGCPFGPPGNKSDPFDYFGPDTVLTPDPESTDSGTVTFTTPLQPGQYTYISLEAPPTGVPYLAAGEVNDTVTSALTDTADSSIVPSAVIAVPAPVDVTDQATINGPNAVYATGTVSYKLYSNANCTMQVADGGTKTIITPGEVPPSNPVGAALATNARYYWLLTYSGNGGEHPNTATVGACGNEVMTFGTPVPPPTPTITTTLSGGGQSGAQITVPVNTTVVDTATVSAPGGQPVSGRVSYEVYSSPSCAPFTQLQGAGGGLTTGSGPASNPLTLATGTYYFQASYSGNGTLARAVSPCGSEVLTVAAPSPPPSSVFTSVGSPQINPKTGQLVITGQFPAAGTATGTGIVQQGATLARFDGAVAGLAKRHKSRKCKRGFVRKKGKCVNNAPVLYGSSVLTIPAPGTYSILISPTARVLRALKAGKKLSVVVSTTFQNGAGGTPVTHVQAVSVKLKKAKHGRRHK